MRTLIAGGQVVGPAGATPMDVIIDGETITALAAPGSGLATSWAAEAERVIDASAKYVLPGGIDAHTHM
jgi:dihydropyrimidinase